MDSLEKSQAELKKIRRKSQGARNVMKYEHKEMEVSVVGLGLLPSFFNVILYETRSTETLSYYRSYPGLPKLNF